MVCGSGSLSSLKRLDGPECLESGAIKRPLSRVHRLLAACVAECPVRIADATVCAERPKAFLRLEATLRAPAIAQRACMRAAARERLPPLVGGSE